MRAEKISISLPVTLIHFLMEYQRMHAYKNRSEVIQQALKLLQQKELERFYQEASQEVDPGFDSTIGDGLDDETW